MNPVRIGVIGCGVIGNVHLTKAADCGGVEVVAVADVDAAKRQAAAEKFGVAKAYGDGRKLIADANVEAVILALPTGVRTPLALAALAAGKHVLLEKPAAASAAEIERMIAARGKLVVACCSSRFRHLPGAAAAAKCVASGALGPIRLIRVRGVKPAGEPPTKPPIPWRYSFGLNAGGILVNWGSYDLDYLLGVLGFAPRPAWALARAWHVQPQYEGYVAPGSDAETHVVALVACRGGEAIEIERGEHLAGSGETVWQIIGTTGSLRLRMLGEEGGEIVLDKADAAKGVVSEVLYRREKGQAVDDYAVKMLENFARAVRGLEPPTTGLEQALVLQRITDAIYASWRTGKPVAID